MEFTDYILLVYAFIALYFSSLFFLGYFLGMRNLFTHPKPKFLPEISIIVPCYNKEGGIKETLQSLVNLDYPRDKMEIIVVDDKSTDNSLKIVKDFAEHHRNIRVFESKTNSGGAARPTNIGIRHAKYSYIAVADGDSTPEREALKKMIGFLQEDPKVGGVTCAVLTKNDNTFIQKLQNLEYRMIAFNRKLLDFVDAVYVTPGPFAVYRKDILVEIGMFDEKNITQDIEIVWRMMSKGYKARMCLDARVYSEAPSKFGAWFKQRKRWSIGGAQCLLKYRSMIFSRNMLGYFVVPFFSLSTFLTLFGLGYFAFKIIEKASYYTSYLDYSLRYNSDLISLHDLNYTISVVGIFAFVLIFLSMTSAYIGLIYMRQGKKIHLFNLLFYMFAYLSVYPFITASALYSLTTKKYSW